jgi:hypothetical protein
VASAPASAPATTPPDPRFTLPNAESPDKAAPLLKVKVKEKEKPRKRGFFGRLFGGK